MAGRRICADAELVELTSQISSDKLTVLGFPCNQFGAQEPGSDAEIKAFAMGKGAKFPLFSKIDVNGPAAHPLFQKLKKEAGNKTLLSMFGEDIKWNFGKFLITNGNAIKRYSFPELCLFLFWSIFLRVRAEIVERQWWGQSFKPSGFSDLKVS